MRSASSLLLLLLLAACASAGEPARTMRQEMTEVIDPLSRTLFAVQAEVDAAAEAPPASAARWREGEAAAERMKAIAAGLQSPAKAKDGGEWITLAKEMEARAEAAAKAAQARDGAAFSDAVNALADNCFSCHGKYMPKPAT